ncbi:MAG: ABC transporter ATP-binding protein [Methanophagales archaeon]|nr:ABC transporter ATP-binding protein [Methanophagales archaeon]
MPEIELKNIGNHVFRNMDMKIREGEFLVVLGPNGAGKTTLLNIIAGLIDYEGTILFDGIPVDEVPTSERQIGYLFQNLALFPHLDVAGNVGYSLRVRGGDNGEIGGRVDELLGLMKINHISHRYPKNLSGGEKQRVALARALATSPKVLLLDEPFNSMDAGMCKCLRKEIRGIHERLDITTVFVTHNLTDAEEMGDRIIFINNGRMHEVASKPHQATSNKEAQDCLDCMIDCYCKTDEGCDYGGVDSPACRM